MESHRSVILSFTAGALVSGAFVGAACGRLPETSPEISLRPVRVSASKKPSAYPSLVPSPLPTITHVRSPGPAATPSPSPIGYTGRHVVVSGYIYDVRGALIDGATVVARSLAAGTPFEQSVRTDGGSFVLNGVPEGVIVELIASRPGWTTRRRIAVFQGQTSLRHEVMFGGTSGARTDGAAHFLAPNPEIVRTEPAAGAGNVDGRAGVYRLVLSEPLDTENRRRFEAALRILPANDFANGGLPGSTTNLEGIEDVGYPLAQVVDGLAAVSPYVVRKGSMFRDDPDTRATFAWSDDGRVATFTFTGPLLSGSDDDAAYQLALVSGGPDARIRDLDGDQLGTDAAGSLRAYPPRGELILSAFQVGSPALYDIPGLTDGSDEELWAATHQNVVRFSTRRDEEAPKLLGAVAGVQGNDARIELQFSEPMAAFDGTTGGFVSPRLADDADDLANYTFAVSSKAAKISAVSLDGDDAVEVDPRVTLTLAAEELHDRELRFVAGAFVTSRTGAAAGSVMIQVDAFDPRRVVLVVLNRPDFFDPTLSHLKARARIGDPAGNTTSDHDADRQAPIATL